MTKEPAIEEEKGFAPQSRIHLNRQERCLLWFFPKEGNRDEGGGRLEKILFSFIQRKVQSAFVRSAKNGTRKLTGEQRRNGQKIPEEKEKRERRVERLQKGKT